MSNRDTVSILIVDENEKTRASLIEQLRYPDLRIVGESSFGATAASWADQLDVDVVIVVVEEPVVRALRTVELLTTGATSRPVIAVSSQNNRDMMRKTMLAGARDYLALPAPENDLRKSVIRVHQRELERRFAPAEGSRTTVHSTIITVMGVKGGIGKTVTAVNIAAAIAQGTKQHVALVDTDLQFGDCGVMLDIVPERTIADALGEADPATPHLVDAYLSDHASNLSLLAAPASPGEADQISPDDVGKVLRSLAASNDYVVIDTSPQLDPITALAIDLASIVLVLVVPEVPCIRRTQAALALLEEAGYSRDKVKLLLNRAGKRAEVSNAELEATLGYPIYAEIPDDRAVAQSVSLGVPVIMSDANSSAGRAFTALGRKLAGVATGQRGRAFPWWSRRRQHDLDPNAVPAPPNPVESDALIAAWAPAIRPANPLKPASGEVLDRQLDSAWGGETTGSPGDRLATREPWETERVALVKTAGERQLVAVAEPPATSSK